RAAPGQPPRHGLDRAPRGAGVRAVCGCAREPAGAGRSAGRGSGRRAARGVPHARHGHRGRDGLRNRRPRIGARGGADRAGALAVGRGGARGPCLCRRALRRHRARRRELAPPGARAGRGRRGAGGRDAHPLMSLDFLIDRLDELPATRALAVQLPAPGARLGVAGLPGSSAVVLLAALARRLPQRVFVVVTPTPTDAERWLADGQTLVGDSAVLYPQREALGAEEPHFEIAGERIETLEMLLSGQVRILVTTARAAAERTAVPAALRDMRLVLARGERGAGSGTLREVIQRLEGMGYNRVPTVTEVAEFSVRGGILDVYGFGMAAPARLEWWGDDLASLRTFDLDTQRSAEEIERVTILPVKTEGLATAQAAVQPAASLPGSQRQSLLDLLPTDALLILEQETALGGEVDRAWADAAHHLTIARRLGEEPPAREALFVEPDAWRAALRRFARLSLNSADAAVRFPIAPPEAVARDIKRLRRIVAGEPPTVILCDNE